MRNTPRAKTHAQADAGLATLIAEVYSREGSWPAELAFITEPSLPNHGRMLRFLDCGPTTPDRPCAGDTF
jgi:hypothetical protein